MPPQLNKYEILGGLASGGMAEVWLARTRGMAGFEKVVVVKTILPVLAADPKFTEMFLQEARIASLLNHPNCVQIFDLGVDNGTYYLAMEFIEGFSLSRVLRRVDDSGTRLPLPVISRIVMDVATGLDYAHRLTDRDGALIGIVHRDISPDNILVSFAGATKLVDFGIAKAISEPKSAALTRTGTVKGKHPYMSPEYLKGMPIDGRADQFALGVLFYRALTGIKPFTGVTDALVAKSIIDDTPAPPRKVNPDIPEALERVVLKALEKHPLDRFESARAMRDAIEQAVDRPASSENLGAFMEGLWPPDDEERTALALLAAGKSPNRSSPLLAATPDVFEFGGLTRNTAAAKKSTGSTRRRERRWRVIGGAVLAGAVGTALLIRSISARREASNAPPPVPEVSASDRTPAKTLPPSPGAPAASATIEVVSDPATEVFLGTTLLGKSPGTFPVAAGAQTLHLVNRSLGIDREQKVNLAENQTTKVQVVFGKASLEIRASPWADVKLDGRPLGTTPIPIQSVYEGRHVIDLANPVVHRNRRVTVDLSAGERKSLRESLE